MWVGERKRQQKKEIGIDIDSQLSPKCESLKHCRSNPVNEQQSEKPTGSFQNILSLEKIKIISIRIIFMGL